MISLPVRVRDLPGRVFGCNMCAREGRYGSFLSMVNNEKNLLVSSDDPERKSVIDDFNEVVWNWIPVGRTRLNLAYQK